MRGPAGLLLATVAAASAAVAGSSHRAVAQEATQEGTPRAVRALSRHQRPDAGVILLRLPESDSRPYLAVDRLAVFPELASGPTASRVRAGFIAEADELVLPPARYRLSVSTQGAGAATFEVDLRAGEVAAYRVSPGGRALSDALMYAMYAGASLGLVGGYVMLYVGALSRDEDTVVAGLVVLAGSLVLGILTALVRGMRYAPEYARVAHLRPAESAGGEPSPDGEVPPPPPAYLRVQQD